jgi:L-ribulose-5-phosphate 3-epimerase UlaE
MTKLSHLCDCFCCLSRRVHVHQGSPLDFPCQTSPDTPLHDISDKIHSRVDNKISMRSRVEFVTGSLCEDDPPQQLLRVNCSERSSGKNHISQEQIKSSAMCITGVRSGCCSEEEEVHRKSNLHITAGCVLQEPLGLQICQTEMEIIIVIIINPEVKKKLVVSLKKCVLLVIIQ